MIMSWIKSCFNVLICLIFSAVPMLVLLWLLVWAGSIFGIEAGFPAKVLLLFGAVSVFLSIVGSHRLYASIHAEEERFARWMEDYEEKAKKITQRPRDNFRNKKERKAYLVEHYGSQCQGCKRVFDSPRFLHLALDIPKSQDGWDHICNMVLLCGPCQGMKSGDETLKDLRLANKDSGWMQEGEFKRDIIQHPPSHVSSGASSKK